MTIKRMTDLDLKNQRVLIREDLNVPLKNGEITSDTRIKAAIPTIKQALKAGACVMVMSHLGRPVEGIIDDEHSLAPVATRLSELLKMPVPLIKDWLETPAEVAPGSIVLFENVRFNKGEKENNVALCKKMASLCDIFVMDAFATAHRAEASTCGISEFAPIACAGPLLSKELDAIEQAMENPKHPVVAIVGGSKVSTKLSLLDSLAKKVDCLIIGGGIANTFIAAEGHTVGQSLYEPDLIDEAERLMEYAKAHNIHIPMPIDVVVADKLSEEAESVEKPVAQVDDEDKIFDIGPETIKAYVKILKKAKTILWNGPVGTFEIDQFAAGTKALALAIADVPAFSIAGGGDTLAAIDLYKISDKISYISTGGGAFLTLLEGKPLPAVEALKKG